MQEIILLALSSAFIGAVADVYAKGILNGIDTRSFVALNFVSVAIVTSAIVPFFFELSLPALAIPIFLGIFVVEAIANYFAFDALKAGEVSHVSPLIGLTPLFTLIFSSIAIPSAVTPKILVAALGIISSVYFLNLYGSPLEPLRSLGKKYNFMTIIAACCYGISTILAKFALDIHAFTNVVTLFWIRTLALTLIYLLLFRRSLVFPKEKVRPVFLRSVLVTAQWLLLLTAVSLGNVVIASSLGETIPVFVLFLAYFAYREKITPQKLLAVLIIISSAVYLGL